MFWSNIDRTVLVPGPGGGGGGGGGLPYESDGDSN